MAEHRLTIGTLVWSTLHPNDVARIIELRSEPDRMLAVLMDVDTRDPQFPFNGSPTYKVAVSTLRLYLPDTDNPDDVRRFLNS